MSSQHPFIGYVLELLESFGPVVSRSMFGGHGFYRAGLMFALAFEDVLYFKADDKNRKEFEDKGLAPFTYEGSKGKKIIMSYYEAPAEVMDDGEVMAEWARSAYAAALRASKRKQVKKSQPKRKK